VMILTLPLLFHWLCQYLVCLLTTTSFKQMEFFDKVLHVLMNTFIVIPLRTSSPTGHQTHKCGELVWSFFLFNIQVLVLSVISTILMVNEIGFYIDIILIFSLGPITLGLLGAITLACYYKRCHTWREVNNQTNCCGCCCGKEELEEEGDPKEDIEMEDLPATLATPTMEMGKNENLLRKNKSMSNIAESSKCDVRYHTI
jgi:hypothetical protein